jgi:hypothetical protein
MRTLLRAITVLLALHLASGAAYGASAVDFYLNLLRRGVSDFNAGRFAAAAGELRIGAFGLLDLPDQYQTAQIYLALSADKLGRSDEARRAIDRLLASQRITPRYAALAIPPEVRTAFETLVQRTRATDLATLRRPPAARTPPPNTSGAPPTPPSATVETITITDPTTTEVPREVPPPVSSPVRTTTPTTTAPPAPAAEAAAAPPATVFARVMPSEVEASPSDRRPHAP